MLGPRSIKCRAETCDLTAYPTSRDRTHGQLYDSYECSDHHTSDIPTNAE